MFFLETVVYNTTVEGPEGAEHWGVRLLRKLPAHREAIRSLVQVNGEKVFFKILVYTLYIIKRPVNYFSVLIDIFLALSMIFFEIKRYVVFLERI